MSERREPVWEIRKGCPADLHESWRAYKYHGCTCPKPPHWRPRGRQVRTSAPVPVRRTADVIEDRMEVTLRMTKAGRSQREIALYLRIAGRTVVRYRAELRERGLLPIA